MAVKKAEKALTEAQRVRLVKLMDDAHGLVTGALIGGSNDPRALLSRIEGVIMKAQKVLGGL